MVFYHYLFVRFTSEHKVHRPNLYANDFRRVSVCVKERPKCYFMWFVCVT